ncbi:MAG TPA: methyltransferase domain-containing protein [Micromonosporaceae bacterium]|jgi:SAM-dependent methyltransferase|nr:methyltransferase domain-containing protein [Micromonosporaceae bacterium]
MIDMSTLDPAKLEAAVGKTFSELGIGVTAPLVVLGDRLGLWTALAGAGPTTPASLAARTGLAERYVREWLRGVGIAGYLDYDATEGTFRLTDEFAAVLASDDSPVALVGVFAGFEALWADLGRVEQLFRSGTGMGWGDHHPLLNEAQERFTRPMYLAGLASAWLPAADGVDTALRDGGRLLDIGCGYGVSSLTIAEQWPAARVTGVDIDDASIAHARKTAAAAGLADRVTFEVANATALPRGPYDVVVFTDSLHDMGDPAAAIADARRVLAPDGVLVVVEPLAADRFEDDFANPYARIGYAISTMVCTPSALAQPGGVALGAMAGETRLRDVLHAGGMTRVQRVATESAPFNIVLAARP